MNLKLGCGQSLPYDMSGGTWEYVMGVLAYYEDNSPMSGGLPPNGNLTTFNSGFTGKVYKSDTDTYENFTNSGKELPFPNIKYYNLYKIGTTKETIPSISTSTLTNSFNACDGGICYGQALSETSKWYSDGAGFVNYEAPWSARGGRSGDDAYAGVFASNYGFGCAANYMGSHFILIP